MMRVNALSCVMLSVMHTGLHLVSAKKAPHIITILTDDQGFGDSSYNCENSTGMCANTPNLDSLALSSNTALFSRFYSAAGVCSPTRAAYLTGRTNERDCIHFALNCDSENPADGCCQGKGLPWSEFTTAKAAKKSTLGDYATIMIGKWHLGDLWPKTNLKCYEGNYSSPTQHGFDDWMLTQAEASNSMPNCGCFPVNHTTPGPKPPSGYSDISPHGDHCVVGGGFESDWCYPCTNYYYPNTSDPRGVHELTTKVAGNDAVFVVDHFIAFMNKTLAQNRPFYAHLAFHAIHEPHPAMPEYYDMYKNDPDYLGALTMFDTQLGRLVQTLKDVGVYQDTIIFYTSDNGPHQGEERTNILWSTNFLRQCKASNFEGGIRTPGFMHAPSMITEHKNVSTVTVTSDYLPTIMEILEVETDNPTWALDGMSLLPYIQQNTSMARPKPLGFSWGGLHVIIDNEWKLLSTPNAGQCDFQEPYSSMKKLDDFYLFNIIDDYHELNDQKVAQAARFNMMQGQLTEFLASLQNSQVNETMCASGPSPPTPPLPPAPPSTLCNFTNKQGLNGSDSALVHHVTSKEECCGYCVADKSCTSATFVGSECHIKHVAVQRVTGRGDGSWVCIPPPRHPSLVETL
eukprot:m.259066 g.259066  ORF g.259066 m.259066 type:complete len:628 (-) comp37543_c0_seq1:99-1982(-)